MSPKRGRTDITDALRKAICLEKMRFPTYSGRDLAIFVEKVYGKQLGRSTICEILKQKEKWMQVPDDSKQTKRRKPGQYPGMEEALVVWLNDAIPHYGVSGITDNLLRAKAKEFGAQMGVPEEFKYSSGWLEKLKKRLGIRQMRNGESSNVIFQNSSNMNRPRRNIKIDQDETASGEEILNNMIASYETEQQPAEIQSGIEVYEATPILAQSEQYPKFTPLFDRILVEKFPTDFQADRSQQQSEATVLATGPGARTNEGELIPISLNVGDRVLLPEHGGSKIVIDGKDYFVYRETDILGKWN